MPASRGIVFTLEAALAAMIFVAVLFALLYTPQINNPSFRIQEQMTVAHDLVVANSNNPPQGYEVGSACSSSSSVSVLNVSSYLHWHAEVCMK